MTVLFSKKPILFVIFLLIYVGTVGAQESDFKKPRKSVTDGQETQIASSSQKLVIHEKELMMFKDLAKEKAATLQEELSLTKGQTEKIAYKIYKFSIKAYEVLQSKDPSLEKSRTLFSIAADQKDEMKKILTHNQYHYFKRKTTRIASSPK